MERQRYVMLDLLTAMRISLDLRVLLLVDTVHVFQCDTMCPKLPRSLSQVLKGARRMGRGSRLPCLVTSDDRILVVVEKNRRCNKGYQAIAVIFTPFPLPIQMHPVDKTALDESIVVLT